VPTRHGALLQFWLTGPPSASTSNAVKCRPRGRKPRRASTESAALLPKASERGAAHKAAMITIDNDHR
jgi:hypothetical protein